MKKRISKKTLLHDEVQSRISKMLYNKNIFFKNNPVDNTEINARLIKSFLYRKITSKYPKYNSFTKISTINNLNENELSNLLQDLPDLDELNDSIQKSKEKRNLIKRNKSNISDEENEDIEENEDEINATVESVNAIVESVNSTIKKIKATEKSTNMNEDELTSSESNELNENFTLTDKIFSAVRKIVIVYAFYKLVKWFL
jgi:methyl-accepting chemotaxis protein